MDISWADRLDLFRYAILSAAIAGLVCPLVGAFLYLRRTSFYGIALPQFATTGVVFGYAILGWWIEHVGLGGLTLDNALDDTHAALTYHFAWAAVFTLGGLFALTVTGRKGHSEIGRVAAAFAIANAATYLLGRVAPFGKEHVESLLQGEVLTVGVHEFETLATLLGAVLLLIAWVWRDFLIVSFDPESARVLGKRATGWELLLSLLTGLSVSVGTMTLGPTLVFGLLVLPPIAARRWAGSMPAFLGLSAGIGTVSVALGVAASFELDLPLGPSIVGAAALALLPGLVTGRRAS